jgi:predicted dehydrogenase
MAANRSTAGRGLRSAPGVGIAVPALPPKRKPRLGFAGVGWIGRNRLDAVAQHVDVEITAIAEPTREAAAKVASAYPDAEVTDEFSDLLAMDLDGIVIATPSALHAGQAIAALECGKAVFCQKPLARTAAETGAVIEAARKADRLLGVDLSYRFTTGMRAIRDLISRGELGSIFAVEAVFHNAYGPDKAWFYDVKAAGGGCLLDLGIHLVDLTLWSLDFPKVESVTGLLRNRARPGFRVDDVVEDYAAGQIALVGGTTMQLSCSWRLPAGCDARIELAFFGTRGGACFRNVDGSFYDFIAEHYLPDRSRRIIATPPDAWGGRAAIDWAQRLRVSPGYDPEIEHLSSVATTLDQMYGR